MSPIRRAIAAVVLSAAVGGPGGLALASPADASVRPLRYTVRAGDSFFAVGARFGLSARDVANANGLRLTSVVHPGQVLVVPVDVPAQFPTVLLADPARFALLPRFQAEAKRAGVPADLFMATAYVESGWTQSAVSPSGAVGVGQLKPDTVAWVSVKLLHDRTLDPADVRDNIRMSAALLRYLLDNTKDATTALASYYQGPGAVARTGISATGLTYAGRILAARPLFA